MGEIRKIVITGATRGIGRALVDAMIGKGHTILGCGRSRDAINRLRAACTSPNRFDTVDVSQWEQVRAWAQAVLGESGCPDLLINNAGVINRNAPLWQVSDEEFTRVMQTNVMGTANLIRAFAPAMMDAGKGVIVNMSSGWGRSTAPEVAPYCASKWAIEGMTKALSQELPPGLAVVAVNPGIIDTDMLRSCWGDAAARYPSPETWVEQAADFMLSLSAKDNGGSLNVR
ncbi:MAG: SDR family oxidoreductase [Planctomycetota bacterium]